MSIRSISAQLPLESEQPAWFAFRTAYKREKQVGKRLLAQAIENYVPLRTVTRQYKSKRKTLQIPLLSTYIFVRLTAKQYGIVLADPDVYEIVKFQGEVGRIKDSEISFLKTVLNENSVTDLQLEMTEGLTKGRAVVVTGGAMAGMKGKILAGTDNKRLQVELTGIGIGFSLFIDPRMLAADQK